MLTGQKNEVQQGSGAIEPHLELKRGFDVSRARPGKKSGRYFPDRTLQVNSIAGTGSKKVSDKTCITPFLKNNITPQSIIRGTKSESNYQDDNESKKKKGRKVGYTIKEELINLEARMNEAAARLDFEKAIDLREQIKSLGQD